MELNFDKEMDALLRQAARSGEVVSTNAQSHLDADEISAFAENALPEKTRANYIKHFADCDRCRLILSNTIVLNAEAETASSAASVPAAPVIEPAEPRVPWYRRIFLMPNLAYTMGALVVAVGAMLGFVVFQSMNSAGEFNMAKDTSANRAPANAPAAVQEDQVSQLGESSNAATMANTANTTANTNVSAAANSAASSNSSVLTVPADTAPTPPPAEQLRTESEDATRDDKTQNAAGRSNTGVQPDGTDVAENRTLAKAAEEKTAQKKEPLPQVSDDVTIAEAPKPAAAAPPPSKDDARMAELSKEKRRASAQETAKQIGGKTFNRTNGVWIDSAYNPNAPIRTIRRGSAEYRKLDKQVRIVAESLEGPVIVVWKTVVYRIQ